MAISKHVFSVVIVICWSVIVANSQGDPTACIPKLLPCQSFLKGSPPPTPACCVPLKSIVVEDSQCLCALFNNKGIMEAYNVTADDAIHLAKSCGAHADMSICQKDAAPSTSPSSLAKPPTSATSPAPSPHKSAATANHHFGGSLVLAAILSFIISSF